MPAEAASAFRVILCPCRSLLTARPNARSCTPASSPFRASAKRRSNSSIVSPFRLMIFKMLRAKARRTASSPGYVHSVMVVLPELLKAFTQEGKSDTHKRDKTRARQQKRGQTQQHEAEAQEATELFDLSQGRDFN